MKVGGPPEGRLRRHGAEGRAPVHTRWEEGGGREGGGGKQGAKQKGGGRGG